MIVVIKLGLRARFMLALLPLAAVLVLTFAVAVQQFVELLEAELLDRALVQEMQEFALEYQRDPGRAPATGDGLRAYIARNAQELTALPVPLAALSPGQHEDVVVDSREYFIARKDVGETRLYLLMDIENVELLEDRIVAIALAMGVIGLVLAVLVALLLARMVLQPVSALAREVSTLDPRRRAAPLNRSDDPEIGVIAAALDGYLERLDQVLERERAFTEDASHELRTPLAVISSAAQLLADDHELSKSGRERVERIHRACVQMQSLIEALLFLAREEGPAPAQGCNLDHVVRDAADLCRASLTEKRIDLALHLEPVTLPALPAMAYCVISNLLLNAAHFTTQGRVTVTLTATELSVCDTGIGISPDDLSKIFERRYRGPHSRGLGLGLYLVRRICERLGWTVQAESVTGTGTCFRIGLSPPPTKR